MYYPNLKTTDSELRALRHISDDVKRRITPVFELTRSRKTSKNPLGSLSRRAEQLNEVYSGHPFILDLCTEATLMNSETEALFDESGGYSNWVLFLQANFRENIVPCVLYVEGGSKKNFQDQVIMLRELYRTVCIRTSVADEIASTLYEWTLEVAPEENIILCPILYYVSASEVPTTKAACVFYVTSVIGNRAPGVLIFAGSSFPRTVTELPGCADAAGRFPLAELSLEADLKQTYPNLPIANCDFASVHPRRYETKGGTWVPRIDYVVGDEFRYSRVRGNQGGYAAAAMNIDMHSLTRLPKCWGTDQISSAKSGHVPGASPSFWISVRINCWITMRAARS
ncbi:hypothetical protein LJR030_000533 [Rhizobium sp. LjRoot30]|uniref:beta family protein n=1 Tax=Rhizobium sp. LjRoot30 TaxID=3342320 RepID=UPI003ECF3903